MSGIINCNPILFNGLEVIVGRLPPVTLALGSQIKRQSSRRKKKFTADVSNIVPFIFLSIAKVNQLRDFIKP
jgi:hypothetical protein